MKTPDQHHYLVLLKFPLVLLLTTNTQRQLDRHQNLKVFHYIEVQLEQFA
jgi:hypothetical protein